MNAFGLSSSPGKEGGASVLLFKWGQILEKEVHFLFKRTGLPRPCESQSLSPLLPNFQPLLPRMAPPTSSLQLRKFLPVLQSPLSHHPFQEALPTMGPLGPLGLTCTYPTCLHPDSSSESSISCTPLTTPPTHRTGQGL